MSKPELHLRLSVHAIPLLLFILFRKFLQRLLLLPLLLREIEPVHGTSAAQAQPRFHTLKVKKMRGVAR